MKLKPTTTATAKGLRPYQEDRVFTASYSKGLLIGVFDGHGGHEVAQLAVTELPGFFADEIEKPKASPKTALKKAIHKLVVQTQAEYAGSTLSLAYIPYRGNTVYGAVLGDSPILIKDAEGKINISPEHNVRTNMEERRAAEARGGFVMNGYLCQSYDGGGLQMARALGDASLSRVLSRVPDIYSVKVNTDSFVIVATDGAFDPGHYEFAKAAEDVAKLVEAGGNAQEVVNRAVEARTGDNVTAVVARFEKTTRKRKNANPDNDHQAAMAG
jgi:serine/threonine protein phosphatase PrpC